MGEKDKRHRLEEAPFDYQVTKGGKMMIYYEGRQIMMLGEKESSRLISRIEGKSVFDIQMALAKVTGNFKRGNEKMAKKKSR